MFSASIVLEIFLWQLSFVKSSLHNEFWHLLGKAFEDILGQGENAGNQTNLMFSVIFHLLSANALNLDKAKILMSGKRLIDSWYWWHLNRPACGHWHYFLI